MTEQEFFNRISNRLGRSTPLTEVPCREVIGAPEFWLDDELSSGERIDKFRLELEKLGGQVDVFDSLDDLRQGLSVRLDALSPERVGTWRTAIDGFGLQALLGAYDVVVWGGDGRERGADAKSPDDIVHTIQDFASVDVGITGCDFAIADTGTVVLMCDANKGRSVSLLPSVHIVIVKEDQIRTRMGDVLSELSGRQVNGQNQPSSVNFISGPSRSSDIENDLSIGVHGPAAVMAMVMRGQRE